MSKANQAAVQAKKPTKKAPQAPSEAAQGKNSVPGDLESVQQENAILRAQQTELLRLLQSTRAEVSMALDHIDTRIKAAFPGGGK